jgi:hypothetical protein
MYEDINGKANPEHLKTATEYALDVFGSKRYAPWLHFYTAVAGEFREGWIPENFYFCAVVPTLKGDYGDLSYLKALHEPLFASDCFPDVAYLVNGLFLDRKYRPVDGSRLKDLLFSDCDKIVFKLDHTYKGKGIHFLTKGEVDLEAIRLLGNGVFQHYIRQHDLFDSFTDKSVATLRITTVADDAGAISVRACDLRFGTGDDTHVKSMTRIRLPIDPTSGAFSDHGYKGDWHSVDRHPDNNVPFAGKSVPAFGQCVSTALELHGRVPFARCIGWDVIVDRAGQVKVMEWNGDTNDIRFGEATQGPCFHGLGWEKIKPNVVSAFRR